MLDAAVGGAQENVQPKQVCPLPLCLSNRYQLILSWSLFPSILSPFCAANSKIGIHCCTDGDLFKTRGRGHKERLRSCSMLTVIILWRWSPQQVVIVTSSRSEGLDNLLR